MTAWQKTPLFWKRGTTRSNRISHSLPSFPSRQSRPLGPLLHRILWKHPNCPVVLGDHGPVITAKAMLNRIPFHYLLLLCLLKIDLRVLKSPMLRYPSLLGCLWLGSSLDGSHGFLVPGERCPGLGVQRHEARGSPAHSECAESEDSELVLLVLLHS